jgi:hypothetical protein
MDETTRALDRVDAPPLAPASEPIDRVHLQRMTFGEESLTREVLTLFDRQAVMLHARMLGAEPPVIAALAHTIKGSAQGIGARRVAHAAGAVEASAGSRHGELTVEIERLAVAIEETRRAIRELLHAH